MFTGLVEEIGKVIKISKGVNSSKLTIEAEKVVDGTKLGDSIAVNGTCVTVVDLGSSLFTVDVMAETLRMGSLGSLKTGSRVNLERALRVGDRLGGHIVSGHIDGVGKIVEIHEEDISTWVEIEAASNLMRYIVLKGSVALDGVSLTVAKLGRRSFSVSLIPHTKGETVLNYKKTGELVNIECDLMGKYVERLMGIPDEKVQNKSNLDSEMLKKYGFI
ncbi:MAG: riboflavin synthase [Clostridium sp.]|uniref:riboflavin synthase n=1 Tax=Clostridium sp. TaxID=1506 RepID=UPI0025BC1D7A|nr:riboflavin synthase [Clostridium sp.]MCH3964638.1 riboflavin synthase [Clostridium sp.]MCI1715109.1 riboflavin synthase [Clostridium sp.]MCI1799371.1 riboflavin synthase [Clostridium sp.]MCI1813292.1 riboflavin synthase [Clostridium sp.]MCI1870183.1 riboflavin synthase [Clostridium sp.]